jgi:hypothetical protein
MSEPKAIASNGKPTSGLEALPMLDHLMLWVARIFSLWLLADLLYVAGIVAWGDGRFIRLALRHHVILHWRGDYSAEAFFLSFMLVAAALWNLSLWYPRKDAGRLYLGLSSALLCVAFAWMLSSSLVQDSRLPSTAWMNGVLPMVGFFTMAWTAFRAPGLPGIKLKLTRSIHRGSSIPPKQYFPLFFTYLFRNSVPSA